MGKTLYYLLKTARPRQWLKNLALYAALIFSGFFFFEFPFYIVKVTQAFILFCILTSSIYVFNDIVDVESDRQHPFKKKRPIASGNLPIPIAVFFAIAGFLVVVFSSFFLNPFF